MFITNLGRMGDEDGSTFIIKEKYLKDKNDEGLKYSTIYNVWEQAFMNMVNK